MNICRSGGEEGHRARERGEEDWGMNLLERERERERV